MSAMDPPLCVEKEKLLTFHGDTRRDPFHWLRERKNPEVKKFLKEENAYTQWVLKHGFRLRAREGLPSLPPTTGTAADQEEGERERAAVESGAPAPASGDTDPLQKVLFEEMKARWKETDTSLPLREHNYWYYSRHVEGLDHEIYCRIPYNSCPSFLYDFVDALAEDENAILPTHPDEQVIVDVNKMAAEEKVDNIHVSCCETDPTNEDLVAIAVDLSNDNGKHTIIVKNIRTDEILQRFVAKPEAKSTVKKAKGRDTTDGDEEEPESDDEEVEDEEIEEEDEEEEKSEEEEDGGEEEQEEDDGDDHDEVPGHISDEVLFQNGYLFYWTMDKTLRNHELHQLKLGADPEKDSVVLFTEEDTTFSPCGLSRTADEQYLTFESVHATSSEAYYWPVASLQLPTENNIAAGPGGTVTTSPQGTGTPFCFRSFHPRTEKLEYSIDHHPHLFGPGAGGWIVVHNGAGCTNFRVDCVSDKDLTVLLSSTENTGGSSRGKEEHDAATGRKRTRTTSSSSLPAGGGTSTAACSASSKCRQTQAEAEGDAAPGTVPLLPTAVPIPAVWRPLIAYDPHVTVGSVDCFEHYVLVDVREGGVTGVLLTSLAACQRALSTGTTLSYPSSALPSAHPSSTSNEENTGTAPPLPPPRVSPPTSPTTHTQQLLDVKSLVTFDGEETRSMNHLSICSNGDFYTATTFRIAIWNMNHPYRCVEVDPKTYETKFLRRELVRGYDPTLYAEERVWVPATQNRCDPLDPETNLDLGKPALIPVSLCYRKDMFQPGTNPCLMHGYGSYGSSYDGEFSSSRVSLLDRGFVYAVACVRGGGEMGRIWRNAGRMQYKMNTFTDFCDCGEYLIKHGYSHPRKLCGTGASAGGMLMGVVLHLKPQLWRTLLADVPFVDCLTTMLDPNLPLTAGEWDEWGNPLKDEQFYRLIGEYSPMDHVPQPNDAPTAPVYPNLFVSSGLSDRAVAYWEPAAWVSRLRRVWANSAEAGRWLGHKCVLEAGHSGSTGRYKALEEAAEEYSFLLQSLSIFK